MQVKQKELAAKGIKLFVKDEHGDEVARAYLYILKNDLKDKPFGFMEDVFVSETQRGKGLGTTIVKALIDEAKKKGCYKIVATSRHSKPKVHALYNKIGFENFGTEFKMYLS